jgi:DNA-binding transcriptional regulator GbsR (MarR family)
MTSRPPARKRKEPADDVLVRERTQFVDIVGTEMGAIWRSVTRLGGQCVASLYLWDEPRSMDDLAEELGRSKSNVFTNLRALEALGIVRRVRVAGSAKDHYELAGEYPDVLVVAFARHLSHTLHDKSRELREMGERLGEVDDPKVSALRERVLRIGDTYAAAGRLIGGLMPEPGGANDIVSLLGRITPSLLVDVASLFAKSTKSRKKGR